MLKKAIYIACFLFLSCQITFAQITRTQLVGAYLYNFVKHTSWQNQESIDRIKLLAITENEEIIEELKKMTSTQTVNGLKIELRVIDKIDDPFIMSHIIYCGQDKKHLYESIYEKIEGKNILLVGENYDNQRNVMLNLYDTNDGNLRFEMNKANILNQNLTISDEILITGGDEIDVIKLYLKSQQSLHSLEKQLSSNEHKLLIFNNQIAKSKANIKEQSQLIEEQKSTIENQQQKFNSISSEMRLLTEELNKQHQLIEIEKLKLNSLSDSLINSQLLLNNQLNEIADGNRILTEQQEKIDLMNEELSNKNVELVKRDKKIDLQQRTMFAFGLLTLLIISLTLFLSRAYSKNKQKNILLSKQKSELNSKNLELSETIHQLNDTQNQLVNAEKMASLGVLTAGIAHEINNPINFVYTGATNLKQEFKDIDKVLKEFNSKISTKEEAFEMVQKIALLKEKHDFKEAYDLIPQIINDIEVGAYRTAEIVDGLKNFSRMDQSSFSNIDLHKAIEGTLVLLKNEYKNKIEIIKQFDKNPPIIEGTPGKINQVVLNIVKNAIDAIDEKGEITIKTKVNNDNIVLSIKDNGKGMDPETIEHMFDPFYTTKEVGKGTGLGLSISFGIINDHNGKIEVKSEINKGAEIIITLPLSQEHYKEQIV